jgi:alginate O-acetyltransferase complex protein AlgI
MLFNSLGFLFVFLPIAYVVFWRLTTRQQRYIWLTIAGYVFYSFWNYKFCALMLFSTVVSYAAGLGLLRWTDAFRRRLCVVVPVVTDLALLAFFKYFNFLVGNVSALSSLVHRPIAAPTLDIVLPVGISFYTFHTITYIVDAYRGTIVPTRRFFEFAAYVSLFPQLVAGPIVRFSQIERDLDRIDRADRTADVNLGWSFFAIGLAKKVLIADTIAAIINPALQTYGELSTPDVWLCMLGYSYQLYFDFSGYSDMAVGLGYLFGLRLPQNFNSPYKATDIADFWRRWHISLSSFLRDYLYIPMGGNRGGALKVFRNLMITMLLAGLWHGASWTFVIWGAYLGLLLVLHRAVRRQWASLPVWSQRSGTFGLIVIGWVLFRSTDFEMARVLIGRMFSWYPGSGPAIVGGPLLVLVVAVAAAFAHFGHNTFEMRHDWTPAPVAGLAALALTCLFILYGSQPSPFLYFQF